MAPKADGLAKSRLYRSARGRAVVMGLYERQRARIPFPCGSRMVATRFGSTHVLTAGPEMAPPLVLIHGVNFAAPFMAEFARPLAQTFRLYIPDIIGQPGRSAETLPPARSYGPWLNDVLDELCLKSTALMGISFGGAVVLDFAALAPQRVAKAVLIVPAGFTGGSGPFTLLRHLFIPWHFYRLFPDRARVAQTVRPLAWRMTETDYDYFDAILRHVRWLIPPPGPFSHDQLQRFAAPVAVYAARHDIFFPGEDLVREAQNVISNLAEARIYDSSHFPTADMQADVMERAARFLTAD